MSADDEQCKEGISQSPVSTVSVVLKVLLIYKARRDVHEAIFVRKCFLGRNHLRLQLGSLCSGHVLPVNYGRNTKKRLLVHAHPPSQSFEPVCGT